jgi:hypothetical protein
MDAEERFTLNVGGRFEWSEGFTPEQEGGGGRWVPVTHFPEQRNLVKGFGPQLAATRNAGQGPLRTGQIEPDRVERRPGILRTERQEAVMTAVGCRALVLLALVASLSNVVRAQNLPADPRDPLLNQGPKPEAVGDKVMVSTQLAVATQTALQVLREGGGNAADAAISATFVQNVADYHQVSLFGAMTGIYYEASTGKYHAFNAYGGRPLADRSPHGDPNKVSIAGKVKALEIDIDLPKENLELFFRLEADRMANAVLRGWEAQRFTVLEQILGGRQRPDDPRGRFHEVVNGVTGVVHPIIPSLRRPSPGLRVLQSGEHAPHLRP